MRPKAASEKRQLEHSGGRSSWPAPFLVRTYRMVEDGKTDDVISWGEKGVSFVVWKPIEFARDLLPAYFKHNNFSSFIRQLNTYEFRKVATDRWEFANDNFRQGNQRLLFEIHRRKAPYSVPPRTTPVPSPALHPLPSSTSHSGEDNKPSSTSTQPPPSELILDLSKQNEILRRDNRMLSTELSRAKRHCQELLNFLSRHVDAVGVDGEKEAVKSCLEVGEEEEKRCLKLFGVNLKGCCGVVPKRKRRQSDGGAVAAVGGSWINKVAFSGERSK
ncbi:hypothetical protein HPP92_016386 [Vanilla planifolia]|uniref:HSF-type DNA-binding domain-containing protein n=1 Tax=Vanilla planifolia TaxID=51239 RepID=A0A835QAU1_VANPL|nr:hypothetical protein HPP92_016386 [Vanilla planifolia]